MAAWLALIVLVISGFILVGRHDALVIGDFNAADLAMIVSGLLLTIWLSAAWLPQLRETHPRAHRLLVRLGLLTGLVGASLLANGMIGGGIIAGENSVNAARPTRPTLPAHAALPTHLDLPALLPAAIAEPLDRWLRPGFRAPLSEPAAIGSSDKTVRIRGQMDGRYLASATINGTPAALLFDSGAAAVVLKSTDARNAGIDLAQLSFTTPIDTARGTTYVARLRLRRVQIGIIAIDDVEAFVAAPGQLETSLLGISFLSRLRSYEMRGGFLTLRG